MDVQELKVRKVSVLEVIAYAFALALTAVVFAFMPGAVVGILIFPYVNSAVRAYTGRRLILSAVALGALAVCGVAVVYMLESWLWMYGESVTWANWFAYAATSTAVVLSLTVVFLCSDAFLPDRRSELEKLFH